MPVSAVFVDGSSAC